MPRDLDLTFDISTGALTLDRVVGNYVKRSETLTLSVTIVSNGASATIPSGLVGTLKPVNTYGTVLAQWTTFAQVGATNVYTASTTINAAAVSTLLGTTTEQANCVLDFAGAGVVESDTLALVLKNNVTRDDDTAPTALLNRNDFLVTNGTGLLVNVAAGYAANGAFVAAQASLAITNATNYIEVTAAGVASVNTTAFTAGSYPLATVVASAGAITSNTDLRAWITPKPAAAGGVTSITGTANEITVTGTTTPTLSLPTALTFTAKTVTGGTFNSGAFNGTVGATTPSTVAGTTGTFSGAVTGATFNAVKLNLGLGNDSRSIALGDFALASTTTGSNNYAFGRSALNSTTTGSGNLAFGGGTLAFNVTGDENTAIGANALLQALGSRNVALGNAAGQYETGSDSLYIDNQDRTNTAGDKAKALLYGTFAATAAAQQLTINAGTITLNGSAVTAATGTFTSTTSLLLGTAGSAVGNIGFRNATSGTTTLAPAAGALGTGTVTLPLSGTLAISSGANTFTGVQSMTSPDITTSITTPSTTFAIANATATTLNIGGAATTIAMGAAGAGTMNIPLTTSASSATTGALTIGNGTAATNVGIGGGKVNIGGTLAVGGIATFSANPVVSAASSPGFTCTDGTRSNAFSVYTGTTFQALLQYAATLSATGSSTMLGINTGSAVPIVFSTDNWVERARIAQTTGNFTIASTTDSTTKDTGCLVVEGGIGIEKAVNIGTTLAVTGASTFTGKATMNGGRQSAYVAKTALYTIASATDYCVNCTSGTYSITLPTAVSIAGQEFIVKNSGTGVITIATTSSQTIDGGASGTLTLNQYESLSVMSDGANWIIT